MNKVIFLLFSATVFLISCGKPNDPESLNPGDQSGGYKIVKRFQTSGYAQDVLKKDSLLYIAQGEGGLIIINVANPTNPQTVSITSQDVRGYSTRIAMKDSVVYLAAGSFGLNVLDVSDPAEPMVTVSNLNIKPAKNIHIFGNYMFTAISEQGVNISDISYPTQPDIRGDFTTSGYVYGITTSSDTNLLFAACGEMGLSIYDISDFQQGYGEYPHVGWCDTPGYAEEVVVNDNESLAFLACGTAGLQIIDYADTNNVFIAGSFDGAGYAKSLELRNNKIYMACELGGIQIIDVSNVSHPVLKGKIETEYALGLFVDENYIYVTDDIEGLIIISIPD